VPFIWFWPDGAPSCAILTHDIETSDGLDRCAWAHEDGRARRPSRRRSQVVPEERYEVVHRLLDDLRARGIRDQRARSQSRWGYCSAASEEFLRRVKKINAYVRGVRCARVPLRIALYRHAGWFDAPAVAYDMSIPNAGHLEIQRGGCCTVMPVLHRWHRRATADHDTGLHALPHPQGLLERRLEEPDRIVMARHGLGEPDRSTRLSDRRAAPARVPRAARPACAAA